MALPTLRPLLFLTDLISAMVVTLESLSQSRIVLLKDNGEEDDEVLAAVEKWEVVPPRVGRARTLTKIFFTRWSTMHLPMRYIIASYLPSIIATCLEEADYLLILFSNLKGCEYLDVSPPLGREYSAGSTSFSQTQPTQSECGNVFIS
jgi:hypothetical protein